MAVIKYHDQKQIWSGGGEGISFILQLNSQLLRKYGQEFRSRSLEVAIESKAMEGCCLLVCSPQLAQTNFLDNSGLNLQEVELLAMGWAHLHQAGKCPHRLAYRLIFWRHFLNCGSFLPDDSLASATLTEKKK